MPATPRWCTVSRGSQLDIVRIKSQMGWQMAWYTIIPNTNAEFDVDFGVRDWHGTNAFIRDDAGRVFRTYFINNRGDEAFVNTWNFLDMTALGRQENWEDSPEGYPQSPPYQWWDWHDEYGLREPSRWFGDPDPNDPHEPRPPRESEGVIRVTGTDPELGPSAPACRTDRFAATR